jgi:O-antigen/teichoic acid export membrane protein
MISGDAGRLLLGNGAAQVIAFAGMAGISRLYNAGAIGHWSTCVAFVTFVWSFSQLRTDMSLMQESDVVEKRRLLRLGLLAHLVFSAIAWAISYGFGLFSETNNLLVFSVLLSHGVQQMAVAWQLSERAYRQVNRLRIAGMLIAYPGSLILYFVSGEQGLLWALLAGNLLPPLLWVKIESVQEPHIPPGNWRQLIRKHLPSMSYLSMGNFLLSLSEQGMILLISAYFAPVYTAAFFLAARVCNLPLSFIQSAMSQYNLRHFQDLHDTGKFTTGVVWAYWKRWLPAGLAFFSPVVLFGPELFRLIFGAEWAEAGQFARLLAVVALFRFLSSPTSMGFFVLGKQRLFFGFTLLFTLVFGVTVLLAAQGMGLYTLITANVGMTLLCIIAYNSVMLHQIELR